MSCNNCCWALTNTFNWLAIRSQSSAKLSAEEKLLQQFGIEAAGELLTVWERPSDEGIGVYDSAGQLLVGAPVTHVAHERSVISKEGLVLSIRSTHAPGKDPGRPWHEIPLIIGTVMSALFSGYMAYYLASRSMLSGRP